MAKIVIALFFIGIFLMMIYFYAGGSFSYPQEVRSSIFFPHFYGDAARPLNSISANIFYFVPKDRIKTADNSLNDFSGSFDKLKNFHEKQFRGTSKIAYRYHREKIIGDHNEDYYKESTAHLLLEELKQKTLIAKDEIYLVVYEGEGAGGEDGISFVSRNFLDGEEYKNIRATFLAHEFYHSLGVPDAYNIAYDVFKNKEKVETGILTSEDIMARVRLPIEYEFLSADTLSKMGLK